MFIREKSKTVKGKKYIQHQLIESIRTPAGPRQRLVLNLGCLDLHQDKWKELANTIESEVHQQSRLFVTDPQIEKLARHYAKVIIRDKLNKAHESSAGDNGADSLSTDYQSVDVNSVTQPEKDSQWPHDYYLHALERQCAREEVASFRIEAEPLKTVRAIMTPMIFQVTEDTPVQQVADMMIKNRIHRVFVTRDGKVVGIISTPDMLKVIRDI